MGTTLLQPFGEVRVCPKGTHHPPGLGQGPGQGERYAYDGSYIANGTGNSSSSSSKNSGKDPSTSGGTGKSVGDAAGSDDTAGEPRSREGAQHGGQQRPVASDGRPTSGRLSIVVPKTDSAPTVQPRLTLLFPEKRVPESVSGTGSADGLQKSPRATPASSTVSGGLTKGLGAEAGREREVGLERSLPTGDAREVSPAARVVVPPPGSVTLVKPRVKRVRLKVWLVSAS